MSRIFSLGITCCMAMLASNPSHAQLSHEWTVGAGGTAFAGDVGMGFSPSSTMNWQFGYRLQFAEHYAVKARYGEGQIEANDAQSSIALRQQRGLAVTNPFQTGSLSLEVSFLPLNVPARDFQHSPYLSIGKGVMSHDPMAEYQGSMHRLQPLGTEGQGTSLSGEPMYSLRVWTNPFTLGWRFQFDGWLVLFTEATWTTVSSDYLDDASGNYVDAIALGQLRGETAAYFSDPGGNHSSQIGYPRGNANNQDMFFEGHVGIGVVLEPFLERCHTFLHR